jgi:transcriptional regulator with XRE-family HTH domain
MIGLEYILKVRKIQQTDLAKDLGIAKQNVSKWIRLEKKIPKNTLKTLSDRFKISELVIQSELTTDTIKELSQ